MKTGIVKLGMKVEDIVTGFVGIVIEIDEYLHGCNRCCVKPQKLKDEVPVKSYTFDETQLKVLDEKPIMEVPKADLHVELGQECVDQMSGFKGIVYGRAYYLNGCTRVCLWPKNVTKDNKIETHWFDEEVLTVVIPKPVVPRGNRDTGGPAHLGPSR